jgi:hypothetical protein
MHGSVHERKGMIRADCTMSPCHSNMPDMS